MRIRKSTEQDLDRMMEIYAYARIFMARHGNPDQWGPTNWPPEALIRKDIADGNSYVCENGEGRVVGTFFYTCGEDIEPTYRQITDGAWLDSSPYGVVHRIASDGSEKGVGAFCINWAYEQCGHLRIDTHGDNTVMQNLVGKLGFVHCGTIYVEEDDAPRLAYEKSGAIQMNALENRNNRIIEAILEKEKTLCPGAVALIGIYGSFQTGDVQPLSDLDLLILINDDRGWQLSAQFIQDDLGVGHDIYCTDWEELRRDAGFEHPHISKLMDSRIVYCADEKYRGELEKLRDRVREKLAGPFGEEDFQKAENVLKEARCCFAKAMTEEDLSAVRRQAGGTVYFAENAIAMLNKTYFRLGVRRRFEELNAMEKRPENLCGIIGEIAAAETVSCVKDRLTLLMKELEACFRKAGQEFQPEKRPACAETLTGTYEEMFSNWHGKMVLAAESGNRYLAFMSLVSMNEMLCGISGGVDIGPFDALSVYDPADLKKTADGTGKLLEDYLREYERAGLKANRFADVDAFIAAYLKPGKN